MDLLSDKEYKLFMVGRPSRLDLHRNGLGSLTMRPQSLVKLVGESVFFLWEQLYCSHGIRLQYWSNMIQSVSSYLFRKRVMN